MRCGDGITLDQYGETCDNGINDGSYGDLVLLELETGHDLTTEPLRVDTDLETIELGPWVPEGDTSSFRFILEAPTAAVTVPVPSSHAGTAMKRPCCR